MVAHHVALVAAFGGAPSLKRARYHEAWLFLFLKVKQSNPRATEWREALKALKKHAEKHAELFQRAQVALEGLADIHATDVAHCANPLPTSLAYLAATRAGAATFRLLPALLQQRIDALGPTVSHRPTLDKLGHAERRDFPVARPRRRWYF
jgi:hypothetical protein